MTTTRVITTDKGTEFTLCDLCGHWDRKWRLYAKDSKCECCASKFDDEPKMERAEPKKPRAARRSESPQAQYMRDYRERKRNGGYVEPRTKRTEDET